MIRLLRFAGVAIAIAAFIDPVVTLPASDRPVVAVVVRESPTFNLPATDGESRRAVAAHVRDRIVSALRTSYDVRADITSDVRGAVVIADQYASTGDAAIPIGAVDVGAEPIAPNVRLVHVAAPHRVPAATTVWIGIDCEARGVAGQKSIVFVLAGPLTLATADHTWTRDVERWHAELDVPQAGAPPFVFRVRVQPLAAERTDRDNEADVSVDARREPFRVLVFEPRPSWTTAFARRALEIDPRFAVAGVMRTSRGVATRTGSDVSLTDAALADAEVVVVGGVDALTAADVRLLDRFMRERGGVVMAAPDARVAPPAVTDWLRLGAVREQLSETPHVLEAPSPFPRLRASELLLVNPDAASAERLAWTSEKASSTIVFAVPRGLGRLVFVGALDAWRYRADDDRAFDRFWQAAAAASAMAAVRPVEIALMPAVVRPKQLIEVEARVQSDSVSASVDGMPVRLWPAAEKHVFKGTFEAPAAEGMLRVVVRGEGAIRGEDARMLVVRNDAKDVLPGVQAPVAWIAAAHDGVNATPSTPGAATEFIRRAVPPAAARAARRPLRSAWWFVPFAACLSFEWYLRRRRGLR